MSISNKQLKDFVDEIFNRHSNLNKQMLTIQELHGFFSIFIKGNKQVSLLDVQKTLQLIKTGSKDGINKKQMYDVIVMLVQKRKQTNPEIKQKKQKDYQKEVQKQKQKDRGATSLDIQNLSNKNRSRQMSARKAQPILNIPNNFNLNNMNPYGLPNRFVTDQRVANQFLSPHRAFQYANQNAFNNLRTFR